MVVAKGSHREGRHPLESDAARMEGYYAPAGSFVVFGGCLQHGSMSRLNPGMRISINGYFCQPYIVPQECLQGEFEDVAAKGKASLSIGLARCVEWLGSTRPRLYAHAFH